MTLCLLVLLWGSHGSEKVHDCILLSTTTIVRSVVPRPKISSCRNKKVVACQHSITVQIMSILRTVRGSEGLYEKWLGYRLRSDCCTSSLSISQSPYSTDELLSLQNTSDLSPSVDMDSTSGKPRYKRLRGRPGVICREYRNLADKFNPPQRPTLYNNTQ